MIGTIRARVMRVMPAALLLTFIMLSAAPVMGNRYTSTNYVIDASTMNSFGGQGTSNSYKLTSSGGEAVIGNGSGGSYKLGQGYVAQLDANPSLKLAVQPNGLMLYMPFDEGSGLSAYDASANGWVGTLLNSNQWSAGKVGSYSIASSGARDVALNDKFATDTVTVEAWVKPATTGSGTSRRGIVSNSRDGSGTYTGYGLEAVQNGSAITAAFRVWKNDGSATYGTTHSLAPLSGDTWHHLVGTYDGNVVRLYVNGVEVATNTNYSGTLGVPSDNLRIGSFGSFITSRFIGDTDEVKIFNRALSVPEIKAEYEAGQLAVTAGLALGSVIPGISKTVNFDSIIKATSSSGYNLAVSQNRNLSKLPSVTTDFLQDFDSIASGTTLTTANTGFTSITTTSGATYQAESSTSPIHGTYSRFITPSTFTRADYSFTATNKKYFRGYFRVDDLPTANNALWIERNDSTNVADVQLATDGKIRLRASQVLQQASTTAILPDEWFRIELEWDGGANTQVLRIYAGANVNSQTPSEVLNGSAGGAVLNNFLTGINSAEANYELDVDELAISAAGWIGASGTSTISSTSGSIASPSAWNEGTTKGLGFSISAAPSLDSKWASGANYAALPNSSTTFYSRSGVLNNQIDTIAMRARLDVNTTQASGEYRNTVTVIGTTLP